MSNLIVPGGVGRTVPEWFAIAMRDVDPSLIVFFNPIRSRWVIDRCTAAGVHHQSDHQHTPECPRTNVRILQGETGDYMPLCQEAIDWLRANDSWNKFKNAEEYIASLLAKDDALREKLRLARKDNTRHATLDGKRQLLKMRHLMQQHDMVVNQ